MVRFIFKKFQMEMAKRIINAQNTFPDNHYENFTENICPCNFHFFPLEAVITGDNGTALSTMCSCLDSHITQQLPFTMWGEQRWAAACSSFCLGSVTFLSSFLWLVTTSHIGSRVGLPWNLGIHKISKQTTTTKKTSQYFV